MEINKEELKIWIAALRSGDYKQSTGKLQTEFGYCCLGVACEVLIPKELQLLNNFDRLTGATPHGQSNAPQWLKEINDNVENRYNTGLIALNDSQHKSFVEIADILEKLYILSDGNQ